MKGDPDPERSAPVSERIDARHYGDGDRDGEDHRPAHVAPPDADSPQLGTCRNCSNDATIDTDHGAFCDECAALLDLDQ
jgi:hypothetical protein